MVTVGVVEMREAPFREQYDVLRRVMGVPTVRRCCVDATGVGMAMAEAAEEEFGAGRVEAVTFTPAMKDRLATGLKRRIEDRTVRLPADDAVRADLHSVRWDVTAGGAGRFLVSREGDSHADRFWALALAVRLLDEAEQPAAIVCMSPLTQIAKTTRRTHPNSGADAMFPARAFDALVDLIAHAARRRGADGTREEIFEPLDHIESGMCPTLIHVSGSEAMLQDATLAAHRLAGVGVPVQLRVWPGQMHVFQIAGPMVPEADRSLRQIGAYIREVTEWATVPGTVDNHVVEL